VLWLHRAVAAVTIHVAILQNVRHGVEGHVDGGVAQRLDQVLLIPRQPGGATNSGLSAKAGGRNHRLASVNMTTDGMALDRSLGATTKVVLLTMQAMHKQTAARAS
jgi:hypothetical protein